VRISRRPARPRCPLGQTAAHAERLVPLLAS